MQYSILTFNLRIDREHDGEHRQRFRFPLIKETLKEVSPDIICFQEVKKEAESKLVSFLKDYNYVGEYRDNTEAAEANFIFYKKEKFSLLDERTLWLSDAPNIKASRYTEDQSICPRIMTIAKFKTANNEILNIINTHLDHEGEKARQKASRQILDYIKRNINQKEPLILCGDFNAEPNSVAIKNLLSKLIDTTSHISYTYHEYNKKDPKTKIDYIFANNNINVLESKIIEAKEKDKFLSDHHPILLKFNIV